MDFDGTTILDLVVLESIHLDIQLRDGNPDVKPEDIERMEIVAESLARWGAKTSDELTEKKQNRRQNHELQQARFQHKRVAGCVR